MRFILLLIIFIQNVDAITIGAWNIHKENDFKKFQKELNGKLGASDVLCLQEAQEPIISQIADHYDFPYVYAASGTDVILSKHPIIDSGEVLINPKTLRDVPWAEIKINEENILVYSPHLSFKVDGNPFVQKIRGEEMQRIIAHADIHRIPTAIAGDINTVGNILWGQKKEPSIKFAKAAGFIDALDGIRGSTQFAAKFFPMGRIDWILTRDFKVKKGDIGKRGPSDHTWLWAELEL